MTLEDDRIDTGLVLSALLMTLMRKNRKDTVLVHSEQAIVIQLLKLFLTQSATECTGDRFPDVVQHTAFASAQVYGNGHTGLDVFRAKPTV